MRKALLMDAPLGIVTDYAGFFAIGIFAGFIIGYLSSYLNDGRAVNNIDKLRACYPLISFERRSNGLDIIYYHKQAHKIERVGIAGKLTSYQTACDNIERILGA